MKVYETEFDGLKIVEYFKAEDDRGCFIKPWLLNEMKAIFGENAETYFSSSKKGVFRGLHYQAGDKAQKKFVVCLEGAIEDVAVDLRKESPTYGKVFRTRLNTMDGRAVLVPEGFAHGIFAHEDCVIVNFCDKPYSPGDEFGVDCKSIPDIDDLPIMIISEKDARQPSLAEALR